MIRDPRTALIAALLLFLALLPVYVAAGGNNFLLILFTRIIILALAATSLNLILGYGGMVSFGHAVYLGIGGYVVGILAKEGINSGLVQWPLALIVSALFALVIGALSLRTRGVYFIMITLAFAQMLYYVAASLDRYGADDGLTIYRRSQFGLLNLSNKIVFYYLCLGLTVLAILALTNLLRSPTGRAFVAIRDSEVSASCMGINLAYYKTMSFALCGLAGVLLANHTDFVSPAMMHWTRSGDLIVMVVLGGMGSAFGPLIGAVVLLVLEEALSGITEYWQIILGPLLLLIVLFARGGIVGLLRPRHA